MLYCLTKGTSLESFYFRLEPINGTRRIKCFTRFPVEDFHRQFNPRPGSGRQSTCHNWPVCIFVLSVSLDYCLKLELSITDGLEISCSNFLTVSTTNWKSRKMQLVSHPYLLLVLHLKSTSHTNLYKTLKLNFTWLSCRIMSDGNDSYSSDGAQQITDSQRKSQNNRKKRVKKKTTKPKSSQEKWVFESFRIYSIHRGSKLAASIFRRYLGF